MKICDICLRTDQETRVHFRPLLNRTICEKHHKQLIRKGYTYKSMYEPNVFHIKNNIVEIELNHKNKILIASIDLEDFGKIKEHKWHFGVNRYAYTSSLGKKATAMHEVILGSKDGCRVDHINGNGLDNRKTNLRFATHSQNLMNSKIHKHNTSGIRGVYFDNSRKKWCAKIECQSKILSKRCNSLEEAINIRREYESKYFGEFARQDSISPNPETAPNSPEQIAANFAHLD